uniref:NAC domain-containing protein n=1 Tax=Oryza meridionalis TaxID=40149 RepID=A0A0E0F9B1_9ORYZ
MATLPQMAATKERQEAANPTTTTRTLVESVTNWIRVYSDGSVDRLGPPEAAAFMVLVPPYDDPRDGLDVAGIVPVVLPLAPEHRLPAAIDTGHAALLWLRDVACGASDTIVHPAVERLRGAADFSRVFLIGDSAGGVLVHNVAARAGEAGAEALDPIRIAGGVLLHPGFILPEKSPSELENPPTANPTTTTRTLVESVTNWIRVYSDGSVDRLGPPEAAAFMVLVPPYDDPRDGVTVHDVATDHGVDVRLYLTTTAPARRRPVLVHFHGGGFCLSHAAWSLYHRFYARLAVDLDVAGIVSVVLPLAPEHRLPAAIDAGHAALLWLRDVASGGSDTIAHPAVERLLDAADFSRVFLIGDSAGGVLVHNVAARAGEAGAEALDPIRLAGGVLLHPGFILPEKSPSELENPPTPFMTQETVDKFVMLALPVGTTSRDHPYTSPAAAVTAAEGASLPPMLVMVAEEDMLRDAQVEYGEAMARAGKAVETVVSHGRGIGHVFYLNCPSAEDLITFYLPRLIAGKPTKDTEKFICRADVYGSEPSDLAGKFAPVPRCEKGGRFFFTSCKRHKGSSTKKERTAGAGTWVRQNSKEVKNKAGVKVGETQNFRSKKDGRYTDWLMEEHHCCRQQAVAGDEEPVICRMYVSPRAPPDSAARQESAAFVQQQPAPQVSEPPCDKKKRDDVAEEAPAAA